MPDKIKIVLGGSFNPPTIAHTTLLEHAVKEAGKLFHHKSVQGVFVPSSDAYVRRKMDRQKDWGALVFSEDHRVEMLNSCCLSSKLPLGVSAIELDRPDDDGKGSTHRTMRALQDADPKSEYIFLLGADKLHILPKWRNIGAFLDEFRFLVTSREGDSPKQMIAASPLLSKHQGCFHIIPALPDDYAGISSTEARKAIAENNMAKLEQICGHDLAFDIMNLFLPHTPKGGR